MQGSYADIHHLSEAWIENISTLSINENILQYPVLLGQRGI